MENLIVTITLQAVYVKVASNCLALKKEMIKEGAIIVDVGINFENGKIVGDVDFENVCLPLSPPLPRSRTSAPTSPPSLVAWVL